MHGEHDEHGEHREHEQHGEHDLEHGQHEAGARTAVGAAERALLAGAAFSNFQQEAPRAASTRSTSANCSGVFTPRASSALSELTASTVCPCASRMAGQSVR